MTDSNQDQRFNYRDGVSQSDRQLAALNPDYIAVDERTLRDSIVFTQAYSQQLKYVDDNNRETGDWSAFFGGLEADEIVAFINDPASIPEDKAVLCRRPHFVLFLSFLQLLEHSRQHLNTITRRHLEFYYRDFLKLVKKEPIPDHVHVLVELAKNKTHAVLPEGTLLSAGKDSAGKELFYRTERQIVVNQAKIDQIRSLYVDKQTIGIGDVWNQGKVPFEDRFLNMLKIALGDPLPGNDLPHYSLPDQEPTEIDFAFLEKLYESVNFIKDKSGLGMTTFSAFEELMKRKKQRDDAGEPKDSEWKKINKYLGKAGKVTIGSSFELKPDNPRNFRINFEKVFGFDPYAAGSFNGIRGVENINELYQKLQNSEVKDDLKKFGEDDNNKKRFVSWLDFELDDFKSMMQIKIQIDTDWQQIISILEKAGKVKKSDPAFSIKPIDPPDFDNYFVDQTFGKIEFPNSPYPVMSIDAYHEALKKLEEYFFMPVMDFFTLMTQAEKTIETKSEQNIESNVLDQWAIILTDAFKEKTFKKRHEKLEEIWTRTAGINADKINAMARHILGSSYREDNLLSALQQLELYFASPSDFNEIEKLATDDTKFIDWEKDGGVYANLLLIAWRNKDGHDPVPIQEQWLNLYPANDATMISARTGASEGNGSSYWKTFGRVPIDTERENQACQTFGWAISSPLLLLSQGTRTITLTLSFAHNQFDQGKISGWFGQNPPPPFPFEFRLSGEKEWLMPVAEPSIATIDPSEDSSGTETIQFTIKFDEKSASSAPPADYTPIVSTWPVLSISLKQISIDESGQQRYIRYYQPFNALRLNQIDIKVDVSGLTDFLIANDGSMLDSKKPFEPFGLNPIAGSSFYLGHPELAFKLIKNLTFDIEWMNRPSDFKTHYENYGKDEITDNNSFKADVHFVDGRTGNSLNDSEEVLALFSSKPKISFKETGKVDYTSSPILAIRNKNPKDLPRYLQWQLNSPDFQHTNYPVVANKKSAELAAVLTGKKAIDEPSFNADNYVVNPPYTPKIKKLTLGYSASTTIVLNNDALNKQPERVYHIHPFGYRELQADADNTMHFLPQFENEGELYIGVKKLMPPQNLSLLMQMVDGSADPDLEPVSVQWSYLSDNRWVSLEHGNILYDSTRGLLNTGIIEFKLQPVQPNTLLPADLYWLRAVVSGNSNSINDMIAIHTQAVSAEFLNLDNAADHFNQPLQPNSIKRLKKPLPEVKALHQPYTSFGGKAAEQDSVFYTRVSERLRHKQRALGVWDYEHLILEHFPQIHKVKCLPSALNADNEEPGTVVIVVIPDIRNRLPLDPFEPKVPANLLKDIESFLVEKASPWTTVKVRNPRYIEVKVRVGVCFIEGYDIGYYMKILNEDITRFLAPWAYEEGAEIAIGGRIYANSLINFIDQRPYVDYITNLKLFTSEDGEIKSSANDGLWVGTGNRIDGILVSARQHVIDIIPETGYEEELFTGVNYMKIELDFKVA